MAKRELPNIKAIAFYGKTQHQAFSGLTEWLGQNQDAVVILVSTEQDEEDMKTPHQVVVSYEVL